MVPRVTIGIPTRNRRAALSLALESALAQGDDVEVVISDNASDDGTRELCEGIAAREPRLRYRRRSVQSSARANVLAVRDAARGAYFMWLGDEDSLEPGYVRACADVLEQSPAHLLVGGLARYFAPGGAFPEQEDVLQTLEQASPVERLLTYLTLVGYNGLFHGLYRRDALNRFRVSSHVGWDVSLVAAVAFSGKVTTLQTVHIDRRMPRDGDAAGLNAAVGPQEASFARPENVAARIAAELCADVLAREPAYASLSARGRARLALLAANAVMVNKYGSVTSFARARLTLGTRLRGLMKRIAVQG